ncbi:MAG TPA: M6 family metalloprotease domain-containing protein [Myxococcales bacterium]
MSRTSISFVAVLAVLLAAGTSLAVPAAPFPVPLHNADGSVVMGRLLGDENLTWAEDEEGFPLAYDSLIGAWHYATLGPDGRLAPLPYRAGEADPNRLKLTRHLSPTVEASIAALKRRPEYNRPAMIPPRGAVRNLVFLVKFNCTSGCDAATRNTTLPPTAFGPVFNGATGSVKAYYREVSYGTLTLDSTIADDAWIQLPHNDQYYVYNAQTSGGRPDLMIQDAVRALDDKYRSTGGFPFKQYDSDGDGVIDAVDVIHVGPGYETTGNANLIHSHYGNLGDTQSEFTSLDGTWFNAYHTEPELRQGGGVVQIGAICHETAHFFGAPDLYDYNGVSQGVGLWSLMAGGSWSGPGNDGTSPSHPEAYIKKMLGFTTPTLVAASGPQTLTPAETTAKVLKIQAGMPGQEYFLVENRQRTGFDSYLPASGLAIFHVDEAKKTLDYVWSGSAWVLTGWNMDPNHYLVDLEQADGARHLNKDASSGGNQGDAADLYLPGKTFGTATTPNSKPYGTGAAKISIESISKSGTSLSFTVVLNGGTTALGQSCVGDTQCQSGFCASGVCCDQKCDQGLCWGCSVAAGSSQDGRCEQVGVSCNDQNPCTTDDRCRQGTCAGLPKDCGAGGTCKSSGYCNLSTGACEGGGNLADGTACEDGNACTQGDRCQAGACKSGAASSACPAPDSCHEGSACNAATGQCDPFPAKANGTACNDGDLCTGGDACLAGVCLPSTRVSCPAPDSCHGVGTCDSATGKCLSTYPVRPEGSPCDDHNACTSVDACAAGVCKGTPNASTCAADQCHAAGTCSPTTGLCSGTNKPDGTACDDQDANTEADQCTSGLCRGRPLGQGPCSGKADGADCNDGDACTRSDMCLSGQCKGTNPKICNRPPDDCHIAEGICDWQGGECGYLSKPNGVSCDDGDPATADDRCENGRCRGTPVTEPGECEGQADGAACSIGQCQAGACLAPPAPPPPGCGCASSTTPSAASPGPFALLLLSASILRSRKRRGLPPSPSLVDRSLSPENQP